MPSVIAELRNTVSRIKDAIPCQTMRVISTEAICDDFAVTEIAYATKLSEDCSGDLLLSVGE